MGLNGSSELDEMEPAKTRADYNAENI